MENATLKSTKELAEIFGKDRSTINRLIRQNNLKPKNEVGCKLYDLEEALKAFTKDKEEIEVNRRKVEGIKLISKEEVARKFKLSTKTIERLRQRDVTFPKPCIVGARSLRWILAEIDNYILSKRDNFSSEAA